MKEQFATHEVSKQLKGLDFDEECLQVYDARMDRIILRSPLWSQVKQWLFNKHQIYISAVGMDLSKTTETTGGWYCELHQLGGIKRETYLFDGIKVCGYFDSPVTAEIEGIKKAVEYLYKNK